MIRVANTSGLVVHTYMRAPAAARAASASGTPSYTDVLPPAHVVEAFPVGGERRLDRRRIGGGQQARERLAQRRADARAQRRLVGGGRAKRSSAYRMLREIPS